MVGSTTTSGITCKRVDESSRPVVETSADHHIPVRDKPAGGRPTSSLLDWSPVDEDVNPDGPHIPAPLFTSLGAALGAGTVNTQRTHSGVQIVSRRLADSAPRPVLGQNVPSFLAAPQAATLEFVGGGSGTTRTTTSTTAANLQGVDDARRGEAVSGGGVAPPGTSSGGILKNRVVIGTGATPSIIPGNSAAGAALVIEEPAATSFPPRGVDPPARGRKRGPIQSPPPNTLVPTVVFDDEILARTTEQARVDGSWGGGHQFPGSGSSAAGFGPGEVLAGGPPGSVRPPTAGPPPGVFSGAAPKKILESEPARPTTQVFVQRGSGRIVPGPNSSTIGAQPATASWAKNKFVAGASTTPQQRWKPQTAPAVAPPPKFTKTSWGKVAGPALRIGEGGTARSPKIDPTHRSPKLFDQASSHRSPKLFSQGSSSTYQRSPKIDAAMGGAGTTGVGGVPGSSPGKGGRTAPARPSFLRQPGAGVQRRRRSPDPMTASSRVGGSSSSGGTTTTNSNGARTAAGGHEDGGPGTRTAAGGHEDGGAVASAGGQIPEQPDAVSGAEAGVEDKNAFLFLGEQGGADLGETSGGPPVRVDLVGPSEAALSSEGEQIVVGGTVAPATQKVTVRKAVATRVQNNPPMAGESPRISAAGDAGALSADSAGVQPLQVGSAAPSSSNQGGSVGAPSSQSHYSGRVHQTVKGSREITTSLKSSALNEINSILLERNLVPTLSPELPRKRSKSQQPPPPNYNNQRARSPPTRTSPNLGGGPPNPKPAFQVPRRLPPQPKPMTSVLRDPPLPSSSTAPAPNTGAGDQHGAAGGGPPYNSGF